MTMQPTSTFTPTVLNEFRYGYRNTTIQNTAGTLHPTWGRRRLTSLPVRWTPVIYRPSLFPRIC
jgi:hypothetical protein